jgi:cell wall-associated NlpC family hydrolase
MKLLKPPADGADRMRVPVPRILAAAGAALLSAGALAACGATAETAATGGAAQKSAAAASNAAGSANTSRAAKAAAAAAAGAQVDPTAPLPKSHARLVSPVAGETTNAGTAGTSTESAADEMSLPKPTGPATNTKPTSADASGVHGLEANKATALPNGVALPPLEAPQAVMDIIRAGNTIARTPYIWGGGHGSFKDKGFDCSGSVSYALYAAGLIGGSATSGQLMAWGKPGKGRWITVYANGGHTFMEVAGIRFDTSGRQVTGSRWQNAFRPTAGFAVRHPPGL